jgi:membrane protein
VSWWGIAKRVWQQTGEDNISILAAGVAFYSLLSIFPALTALVSVYGLVADPTIVQRELHDLRGVLPADAVSLLSGWLQQLAQRPRSSFGTGLVLSLLLSLWTARYATGAMMTALNVAYDEPESRSLLMFNAVAFALTAVLILFGIAVVALVAVAPAVIGLLPLPAGWVSAVSLLRWPILAALTVVALAALYRYAPNRASPTWEWASAGAIAATAVWIIGSYGFSVYVSRFAGYDQTYGSVGAIVVLLIWFWLGAYAVLLGAELNSGIERKRRPDRISASA